MQFTADCGFAVWTLRLSGWTGIGWPHSEAPYHLYEFSPRTLARLTEASGFSMERMYCRGAGSFAYIVGATGCFDDLKKAMKLGGFIAGGWGVWKKVPALAAVAGLLLPFRLWGRLADKKIIPDAASGFGFASRRLIEIVKSLCNDHTKDPQFGRDCQTAFQDGAVCQGGDGLHPLRSRRIFTAVESCSGRCEALSPGRIAAQVR